MAAYYLVAVAKEQVKAIHPQFQAEEATRVGLRNLQNPECGDLWAQGHGHFGRVQGGAEDWKTGWTGTNFALQALPEVFFLLRRPQ